MLLESFESHVPSLGTHVKRTICLRVRLTSIAALQCGNKKFQALPLDRSFIAVHAFLAHGRQVATEYPVKVTTAPFGNQGTKLHNPVVFSRILIRQCLFLRGIVVYLVFNRSPKSLSSLISESKARQN